MLCLQRCSEIPRNAASDRTRGALSLFWQVSTGGGSFQSCCAVVGELYRDVYAVPKSHVFDDSDGALAALEGKVAAKEEGAKRNLLVALQVS